MHNGIVPSLGRCLYRLLVLPQIPIRAVPVRAPRPLRQACSYTTSKPPFADQQLYNENIRSRYVLLVDQAGQLSQKPFLLSDVLEKINPAEERLAQLQEASEQNGGYPICKVVKKRDEHEARKQKRSEKTLASKEIELNWAIDANDLEHRLARLKGFLAQGRRVEVTCAPRRRGRKATITEAQSLLTRLRAAVSEVEGAKENREMEGKVPIHAKLFFEGRK